MEKVDPVGVCFIGELDRRSNWMDSLLYVVATVLEQALAVVVVEVS